MNTTQNKSLCSDFLQMVVKGQIDEAYEKYVDVSGKHHNAYFAAGFENLRQAMKDSEKESPNKELRMVHIIGDGDIVAVHSELIRKAPEANRIAVVHIFKVQEGKIVEMWDCGMEIPKDCPNLDGVF